MGGFMTTGDAIDIEEIVEYVCSAYPGVIFDENWGERSLFYNPQRKLPKGTYILSFKERDGANDSASDLDGAGVYRLSLGVSRRRYIEMFGPVPTRPAAGETIVGPWDFTVVDKLMPHPVYAWMAWVIVLSPGRQTFENLKPLIEEGYRLAVERFRKRDDSAE